LSSPKPLQSLSTYLSTAVLWRVGMDVVITVGHQGASEMTVCDKQERHFGYIWAVVGSQSADCKQRKEQKGLGTTWEMGQ